MSEGKPRRRWRAFGRKGRRTKGEPAGGSGAAAGEASAPLPPPSFAQDIEDLQLPESFSSEVDGLPSTPPIEVEPPPPTQSSAAAETPPPTETPGATSPGETQPLPLVQEASMAAGVAGLAGGGGAPAAQAQTLGEFAAQEAAQTATEAAPAPVEPPRLVSIADLARAHEEATVEQAIAREVARRRELRRRVVLTLALAIVGTLIGSGIAAVSVSRQQRTGGTLPKVGIQPGLGGLASLSPTGSISPTGTAEPTNTAAQVCVVLLVDDSKETSGNLEKFTQQRLPLNYAILPARTPFTSDVSQKVQANGGQSIVYQPVGGKGSTADGQPGEIKEAQSKRQMANRLIGNITGIIGNQGITPFGFSNTRYPYETVRMMAAMSAKQNSVLMESQEGTRTVLARAASRVQARYAGTDLRLDAQAGEKTFRARWDLALKRAEKNDRVVVVTKLTGLSARVLPPLLAGLDTSKYQLVLLSQLVP